jgi:hypothetical protein
MRFFLPAVFALVLASCRDLTLPPTGAQSPGTVFGHAVYSPPGSAQTQSAAGAVVTLSASSVRVTAGMDGAFNIEGLTHAGGTLLFQLDSDGDGAFDRQRTLSLDAVGAGPGRNINLGDVVIGQSAHVHGLVLRADLRGISAGHGGTQVFMPLSPFVAYSAQDGQYRLDGIPAGPVQLGFFRPGYLPAALDGVMLQPGEDFAAAEVDLARDDGTQTGAIAGTVSYAPAATPDSPVSATSVVDGAVSMATLGADGTFTFPGLKTGLYDVRAAHDGYGGALVPNVLVFPSQTTHVDVSLAQGGSEPDGGRPSPPDGGPLVACASTQDCAPGEWCDDNFCAALCGATVSCNNGRVCDAASHTCVVPCTTNCPSGQTCDPSARVCRTLCDVGLPCGPGFKCSANECVPQCVLDSDCASVHQTCQGGACVPDGTCATDLDCPYTQLCAGTLCTNRKPPPDGVLPDGGWTCAGPCDCRYAESCSSGTCVTDGVPTVVLDGGGLDVALANAQGNAIIALKAGDVYWANDGFTLAKAGVTLSGGYVSCGGPRFIYDSAQTTTLSSDGGITLRVPGTTPAPLRGVMIRGLTLLAAGYPASTESDALSITNAPDLRVFSTQAGITGPSAGGSHVMHVVSSDHVELRDLALLREPLTGTLEGLSVEGSNGSLSGFTAPPYLGNAAFYALHIKAQTGPFVADSVSIGASGTAAVSVFADTCNTQPFELKSSTLGLSQTMGLQVSGCSAVNIHDVFIDGSASTMSAFMAISATASAGTLSHVHVLMPASPATSDALQFAGGAQGPWTLDDFRVDGCGGTGTIAGVHFLGTGVTNITALNIGGPDAGAIGPGCNMTGLLVGGGNTITLKDSTLNTPPGGGAPAIDISGSNLLIERSSVLGPLAVRTQNGSNVEIYSSFLFAKTTGVVSLSGGQLYAVGSTFDGLGSPSVGPSYGLGCSGTTPVAIMKSCIVNGGQNPGGHYIFYPLSGGGPCFLPGNYDHNYFYFSAPNGRTSGDMISQVTTAADGGSDSNQNIMGENVPCYPPSAANPSPALSAGSPCIDRGIQGNRKDGSPVDKDIQTHPRQNGAAPDIGAWEF